MKNQKNRRIQQAELSTLKPEELLERKEKAYRAVLGNFEGKERENVKGEVYILH